MITRWRRWLDVIAVSGGASLLALVACVLVASCSGPSLGAKSAEPSQVRFDAATVATGSALAAIGNCRTCHTAPDGKSYAGALPLETPFGVVYSTNITPDPDTGIGRWSEEDFRRAMQEGVRRDGANLYPVFPYDHFTHVTADDIRAIYAFLMTRDPVAATPPQNRLTFPANVRSTMAAWKAMYFRPGEFRADPARSAEWNRGAYLAQGLGHCGACHTPRNKLGAEVEARDFEGGDAEGWLAPAIEASNPSPSAWTVDEIATYLRRGFSRGHGTATGPMRPVVHDLAQVPEADVRAIAVYVESRMRSGTTAKPSATAAAEALRGRSPVVASDASASGRTSRDDGARVFEGTCATCHEAPAAWPGRKPVALALTTPINAPDPRNAIHIVLDGIWPESSQRGALMPGFANELTDSDIVALLNYLRANYSDRAAWPDVARQVREIRRATQTASEERQ
jgi:mono/diheme cytochrome c family protein